LNRLPKLKAFLFDEAKFYPELEVKYISGVDPKIMFYADGDRLLDTMDISQMDSESLNALLQGRGLKRSTTGIERQQ